MEHTPFTEPTGSTESNRTEGAGEQSFASGAEANGGELPISASGASALDHQPTAGEVDGPTEGVAAETVASTTPFAERILEVAGAAAERNIVLNREAADLRQQAVDLNSRADQLSIAANEEYYTMAGVMHSGRDSLWRVSRNHQGYATGEAAFADAVRLSPQHASQPEPAVFREARVAALHELGAGIVPGEPTVINRRFQRREPVDCYAAVPDHSGFSFRLNEQSEFVLGVGDQTGIPIHAALLEIPRVLPDEPIAYTPGIEVYSGAEAIQFLTNTVTSGVITAEAIGDPFEDPYMDSKIRRSQAGRRDNKVESVAAVVNAASRAGITLDIDHDMYERVIHVLVGYRERFAHVGLSQPASARYGEVGQAIVHLNESSAGR